MYTFDENIVSDLHKDARGFRPGVTWMHAWETSTDEEKQGIWDYLCEELEREMDYQKKMEDRALADFQERVQQAYSLGAKDLETAVRWIIEAEDFSDMDYCYGADYCAWHFGLAYDNPFKEVFAKVCKDLAHWNHLEA